MGTSALPGNPYDGQTLAEQIEQIEQIEQTTTLLQDIGVKPTTANMDLGYRGADADIASVRLIHRGKSKTLTITQRAQLRRRQAVAPVIGHLKADHRMQCCARPASTSDGCSAPSSVSAWPGPSLP